MRIPPGDKAIFRIRWTNSLSDFAESQIDNLSFSGSFQDQDNGFAITDPRTVTSDAGIVVSELARSDTNITLDSSATEPRAFYRLVPEGDPAP